MVTHLNVLMLTSANLGCNKKRILMNEITRFRLISATNFVLIIHNVSQMTAINENRIIGSIINKNNFKMAFDPKGPCTSKSEKKQSNDKKASGEPPSLLIGVKMSFRESGNLLLTNIDAVMMWK